MRARMEQWLKQSVDDLKGHRVLFEFYFLPENTSHNATAEICYYNATGNETITGSWVTNPSTTEWNRAFVTTTIPNNITAIKVVIRGTGDSDFTAWIECASLRLW